MGSASDREGRRLHGSIIRMLPARGGDGMTRLRRGATFVAANVLMWALMTAILIVVPDALERWMSLEFARVVGWAVASGLWVVVLQQPWRSRVGPFTLFTLQVLLWISAALVAIWISDTVRMPTFVERLNRVPGFQGSGSRVLVRSDSTRVRTRVRGVRRD